MTKNLWKGPSSDGEDFNLGWLNPAWMVVGIFLIATWFG